MNCKEVMEAASLYLSRELDEDRGAEVLRHLGSCPACSRVMEEWVDIDTRLRGAVLAEPLDTASIERTVRARIAAPSRRWIGVAAAVAAAIVIAIFTARVHVGGNLTCIDAADDHRREVVNGERRRWLKDAQAIAELAGKQGVVVPQLASDGYRLERGKLCRLNGRVYLHVIFSDMVGDEMSLFLRPADSQPAPEIRNMDAGAEHIAYFATDRVNAIVVTDQSTDAAVRAAGIIEKAL